MNGASSSEKKTSFIDTKYTISFAIRFFGIALIGFVLLGAILFFLLNRRLGINYSQDIATLSNLQEKLPVILITTGIIQAIVLSFVLFILSLFWAHKVAGPLVRFRRYLNMIGKGEIVDEITFREEDQLHYLAKAFRHMQAAGKIRNDKFTLYLQDAEQIIYEYEVLIKQKDQNPLQLENKLNALKKIYGNIRELLRGEDAA